MKVIFLDFDGVLNSERYIRQYDGYGVVIDPVRMGLLAQIVEATDAEIVLTTSWRECWDRDETKCHEIGRNINAIFEKFHMKILDKTPKLYRRREHEIQEWLESADNVESYVVLDDRFLDPVALDHRFVRTSNMRNGLELEDVKRAIEILRK